MTTVADDSHLAGYFDMDPLMGGLGDPFADLSPEEYGDQSRWDDDDDASFTDSDDDSEDDEGDDDCSHGSRDDEGEWNIVYAASFTVVASTSEPNGSPSLAAARRRASSVPDPSAAAAAAVTACGSCSNMPPPLPPPEAIVRRDSKVRFCDQPPKVVSYECCSREEYSQVYYSVHELQKIIDEVRLEKTTTNAPHHPSAATPPATNVALPSRSV